MTNAKIPKIKSISSLAVLDSRGNPTVRVSLTLEGGAYGTASAPSGASTGKYEAHEKRDGGSLYRGKGVSVAVESVNGEISDALCGRGFESQRELDGFLCELDGTDTKSRLGANALLPVSVAYARAAARAAGVPLFRFLTDGTDAPLPCPMMNVLNGGRHAKNNIDIQEFMLVPIGISDYGERVRACAEIYAELGDILTARGHITSVGDEGGYAPMLEADTDALDLLTAAIVDAGYAGAVKLAIDAAASEWQSDGCYLLPKRKEKYTSDGLIEYYRALCTKYPIISIEDGLGEDDLDGWVRLTDALGKEKMLVGDDLFVTNRKRVSDGVKNGRANALLIKPNQAGTVTESIDAAFCARDAGYALVVSHRSGETCDTFISDLAVALGAGFIKAGAPCRSERVEKYNRLSEIALLRSE